MAATLLGYLTLAGWATLAGCSADRPDAAAPSFEAVRAAARLDDGSPLLAPSRPARSATSLRLLVVTPRRQASYGDLRTLQTHLDGFGLRPDYVSADDLDPARLADYSALLVASSSFEAVRLKPAVVRAIAEAVSGGLDLLWIGLQPPRELESTLGIRMVRNRLTTEGGPTTLSWTDGDGFRVREPLNDEFLTEVVPRGASVRATFEPGALPAVTEHRVAPGAGRAILVPFALTLFWGIDEPTAQTWARAELFFETVARLLSHGAVLVAPFPDGHPGALFVRVEDVSPGGQRFSRYDRAWLDRFERMRSELDGWRVPIHLALIGRYVDPMTGEDNGWDTSGRMRQVLRARLSETLAAGGTMVAHGWTHQRGRGAGDVTADDYEFSEDSGGRRTFVPYAEQQARIAKARETLTDAFGVAPIIWETPHFAANADTYRAAAAAGFRYINEDDSSLYPTRLNFPNDLAGRLLNLPQTGAYVPFTSSRAYREVTLAHVLPRLVRMRAPFEFFYHGLTDEQFETMRAIVEAGVRSSLWTPTLTEFGEFWERRERIVVTAEQRAGEPVLHAVVGEAAPGTTLRVRLPDGARALSVRVDGAELPFAAERQRGIAFARIVLPAVHANPARVDVRYGP